MNRLRLSWLPLLAAAMCGSGHAGNVYLPTDIAVTMTANPSTELRTGQIIDIVLTVTNRGPQPADVLVLNSSPFFHEFSVTYIDAVACYQFGGTVGEADPHPIFTAEWFIAGIPDTGMQPFAVGETRTCDFQLTLMTDAPAVTPFTFGVSTMIPTSTRATAAQPYT
jgi:hypothetical protein